LRRTSFPAKQSLRLGAPRVGLALDAALGSVKLMWSRGGESEIYEGGGTEPLREPDATSPRPSSSSAPSTRGGSQLPQSMRDDMRILRWNPSYFARRCPSLPSAHTRCLRMQMGKLVADSVIVG
jgi:hypothetical protein